MNPDIYVTRIVNSCVLFEFGEERVLTDPWFIKRWWAPFGEKLGMKVEELPRLSAIVGSHTVLDHWDISALDSYPHKDTTRVFVATKRMMKKAKAVGFNLIDLVKWGEQRNLSDALSLEVVPAHRVMGMTVNNYIFNYFNKRLFFGGETRDLEPLRKYRLDNAPVDVVLVPVNGVRLLGKKLVMGAKEALTASEILGASYLIPIHYTHPSIPVLIQVQSSIEEAHKLRSGRTIEVVQLETGQKHRLIP